MIEGASEDNPSLLSDFHVIGLDHRTCPDPIREMICVADEELPVFLGNLKDAGFSEAMVMSTCDRVEVRAIHDGNGAPVDKIARALALPTTLSPDQIRPALYHHLGVAALTHLFRVSASLESQVVGEPQVLSQVRASHRMAASLGMSAKRLDPLLQASYATAKRVRAETAISEGPTSLIAAAIRVARSIHGDLSKCRLLVLGVDDIALMLTAQFKEAGLTHIILSDRNARRAGYAAREMAVHLTDFETRAKALADADIVLAATGDGQYSIDAEMIQSASRARRRTPIFIVDLAIPADVDPAVERIDDAFLYDLDDLERLALEGKSSRQDAISEAQRIVEADVSRFIGELSARDAAPLITELRVAIER
ncbi:MAG: glutamyl-tRNA reductase, partial [Alphaproteobacteria bacterium]|nr:glutamyl-tRNA reductase [Alphaproteobacteria bacterium]